MSNANNMSTPTVTFEETDRPTIDQRYVLSSEKLNAACDGFRKLYLDLRHENPSWNEARITEYMFVNDLDYRNFFMEQPSTAELIATDYYDEAKMERLKLAKRKIEENKIGHMEAFQIIDQDELKIRAAKHTMDAMMNEYDGDVDRFITDNTGKKRVKHIVRRGRGRTKPSAARPPPKAAARPAVQPQ